MLQICFVSLLFVSFRMVSLPIDFVLHPKIPFLLLSETSETGGSFLQKKVSLCFASVSLRSEIWGHPMFNTGLSPVQDRLESTS